MTNFIRHRVQHETPHKGTYPNLDNYKFDRTITPPLGISNGINGYGRSSGDSNEGGATHNNYNGAFGGSAIPSCEGVATPFGSPFSSGLGGGGAFNYGDVTNSALMVPM